MSETSGLVLVACTRVDCGHGIDERGLHWMRSLTDAERIAYLTQAVEQLADVVRYLVEETNAHYLKKEVRAVYGLLEMAKGNP